MRQHLTATLAAIGLPYVVASVTLIILIIAGEVAVSVLRAPAGPTTAPAVGMHGPIGWVIPGVATMTALLVGSRLPRYLQPERAPSTVIIIAGALATVGLTPGPLDAVTLLKAAAPAAAVVAGYWLAEAGRRR